MSKQIRFVHDEKDTILFLNYLQSFPVTITTPTGRVLSTIEIDKFVKDMDSIMTQYFIYTQKTEKKVISGRDVLLGFAVEFSNSYKGNGLSRNYESGRLYIHTTMDGKYDSSVLDVYSKLVLFIKRNYYYCKEEKMYCGKNLLTDLKSKKKNATVNGKIVKIQ